MSGRDPGGALLRARRLGEQFPVDAARHEHPKLLRQSAAPLLARLDPDGSEPRDRQLERHRSFGLRKHRDGSATPTGLLTAELTALLETVLDPLAAPAPATEGLRDDRTRPNAATTAWPKPSPGCCARAPCPQPAASRSPSWPAPPSPNCTRPRHRQHHHHREFARHDWHVLMIDGTPWWRPPDWLDPQRKPIRNTTDHLDDSVFDVAKVS